MQIYLYMFTHAEMIPYKRGIDTCARTSLYQAI